MVKRAYKKYSVPNHLSLLQETWDRAYQEGDAKGRVRCLEQHRDEELKESIEKALAEKIKAIEESVEFFDPKNKAIPYVKLDKVLAILKEKR